VRSASYVLAALAAGFVLGSLAAASSSPGVLRLVAIIEPLGTLWVNAIRMTVVPLVVSLLITGVVTSFGSRSLGRLGARALVTYAILLVIAGLIALIVAPPLLARIPLSPDVADRLRATATTAAASTVTAVERMPSLAQRLIETVPANPVRAAADGAMLPLVVFTLVLALGIVRLAVPVRDVVVGFFTGVTDAMLVVVGWVLAVAPVGVFALALSVAARAGIQAAGALLYYIVVLAVTLLLVTLMLYLPAVLFGRVSLRAFVVAALPAQAVAMSSRSSLAALPAMLRETRDRLAMPTEATSFVLPLAVAILRMNVPPRWVISAAFLGQLYGVEMGLASLVWMMVTCRAHQLQRTRHPERQPVHDGARARVVRPAGGGCRPSHRGRHHTGHVQYVGQRDRAHGVDDGRCAPSAACRQSPAASRLGPSSRSDTDIQHLDDDRKCHREVRISLRDVLPDSLCHEVGADQDEKAQGQHLDRWVPVHEVADRSGGHQHDAQRDHVRRDHDRYLIHHPDRGDDRVEREHDVDHHDLRDDGGQRSCSLLGGLAVFAPFDLFVDLVDCLGDEEQAADDQDQPRPDTPTLATVNSGVVRRTTQAMLRSRRIRVTNAPNKPSRRALAR
jgi:Na+/H+-dicarboxylate symporter